VLKVREPLGDSGANSTFIVATEAIDLSRRFEPAVHIGG